MRFCPIIPIILLSACSLVAPGAMERLNAISPLEADPTDIQAILDLPDGIGVVKDGAVLRFSATRNDTGETVDGIFVLAETNDGGRVVYQIAPTDVPRLLALQDKVRVWKKTAPDKTKGSLSIDMAACLKDGGLADGSTFSVWLRTEADQDPFPLVYQSKATNLLEGLAKNRTCPS